MYDKEKYLRRKQRVFKRALLEGTEQFRAFDSIRNKWDFDDKKIGDLLKNYTVTEILDGEMIENSFYPKEKYHLKGLLVALLVILSFAIHSHSSAKPDPEMATLNPNAQTIGDIQSK